MENTLFLNNKSNYSLYTCIETKGSDQWVNEQLKDLRSSNSNHVHNKNNESDAIINEKNSSPENINLSNNEFSNSTDEPWCHVKFNTFLHLKNSTKQLLLLLEEIQLKFHTKHLINDETSKVYHTLCNLPSNELISKSNESNLKRLENCTRNLDTIYIEDQHDDCSVYNRLIRKCNCLNHPDYNDFVIHFNEDSKYITNNVGELIKNMRILRKFLYMGGTYTKNALMFLYEALLESQINEKLDIIQGCAHADICNVFDEHSIVTTCISWPCKYKYYGNCMTQNLAAGFLYKLSEIEQGKRYLNYRSKIVDDIRKVLRKESSSLEMDIVETLNLTLNLLKQPLIKNYPVTCFAESVNEGIAPLMKDLIHNHQSMNFDELYMNLDLLNSYSSVENETDCIRHLPALLSLFKQLLMDYNNSELNILVTSILNNIVNKNVVNNDRTAKLNGLISGENAMEAHTMKDEMCQKPSKQINSKKITKANKYSVNTQNKHRQASKQKGLRMSLNNRSRKFSRDLGKSMIIVPIEEK